MSDYDKLILC